MLHFTHLHPTRETLTTFLTLLLPNLPTFFNVSFNYLPFLLHTHARTHARARTRTHVHSLIFLFSLHSAYISLFFILSVFPSPTLALVSIRCKDLMKYKTPCSISGTMNLQATDFLYSVSLVFSFPATISMSL